MSALVESSTEVQSDFDGNKVQSSVEAAIAAPPNDLAARPYLLATPNVHPRLVIGRTSIDTVKWIMDNKGMDDETFATAIISLRGLRRFSGGGNVTALLHTRSHVRNAGLAAR